MRTYKMNVTELDPGETIVIKHGNNTIEVEAISDDGHHYLEVRVPSAHTLSSMVQNPLWPNESEIFFNNAEWWSSMDPPPEIGGLQEISGPIRFIAFINS